MKTKKRSIKLLKKNLWELCKKIVRIRDGNSCIICGKENISGSNWHTGHLIPSKICGFELRYDLRNLYSSCYNCNINLGGNGALFYRRIVSLYDQDFVDNIFNSYDNKISVTPKIEMYEEKIKEFSEISTWNKTKLLNYTKSYSGKTF